jgi:hypothetical protein
LIIVEPRFALKNDTNLDLYFALFCAMGDRIEVRIEKASNVCLKLPMGQSYSAPKRISIGHAGSDDVWWSKLTSIPNESEIVIPNQDMSLFLIATDSAVVVSPKMIAVNESQYPLCLNIGGEHVTIEENSTVPLLRWPGKREVCVSHRGDRRQLVGFSGPISATVPVLWHREFLMNDEGRDSYYLTYSVETSVLPNSIVFHHDPSPPFAIDNKSPMTVEIMFNANRIRIPSGKKVCLPSAPEILHIGKVGSRLSEVSLQFQAECIIEKDLTIRIQQRANQIRALISPENFAIVTDQKLRVSLFVNDFAIHGYDDFTHPGSPQHLITITLAPISAKLFVAPGECMTMCLSLAQLGVRVLDHFDEAPVILQPVEAGRLLRMCGRFVRNFDGLPVIDSLEVCLKPLRISAEDSHLMYILGILPLFGASENVPVEIPLPGRLTPIYVRRLQIESTYLLLSVAARRVVHADCNDVRVNISSVDVRNSECFPVTLAWSLLDQYISDAVAAVPLVLASISLLGCPLNIVRGALDGIKSSWATGLRESDSLLMGIGRGSMNIIRGITKESLESFVRLAGSLEETIRHLTETSGQENARMGFRGIGQGLLEMVAVPTTALLSLFRRTGRFVLRGVARPDEERQPEVAMRRPLVVLDLAEMMED